MTQSTTSGIQPLTYAEPVEGRRSAPRFLVWAAGIVVIGGMLISVLLPSLCRSGESANRIKCASNLRQIGQAIALYAQDNGGQYPPSLAVLLAHEDITSDVMVCPSSNDERSLAADSARAVDELTAAETNASGHKHCLSYVYAGRGLNVKTMPPTAVVAYEPLNNHGGDGTEVLFGDGHVEWIGKQTWAQMAATRAVARRSSLTIQP